MRSLLCVLSVLSGSLALAPSAVSAQEPTTSSEKPATLERLEAAYQAQLREVDKRYIAELAKFAAQSAPADADAAYRTLFQFAIARACCSEAEHAAENCLASAKTGRAARGLATLVRILDRADRGEFERAVREWEAYLAKTPKAGDTPDDEMTLAVGEACLQRLIRAGRYDVAKKLCESSCDSDAAPSAIKNHFETRMSRLESVGKAAPSIEGTDIEGTNVSLAALKGRVVLIQFWATWCPPCVADMPELNALAEEYKGQGFTILGVNVDAMHEDVKDMKLVRSVVRRFLVERNASWPNVLNGRGAEDFAKAYGVEHVPANFLIGRDGKVVAIEQRGGDLEKAIVRTLGTHSSPETR